MGKLTIALIFVACVIAGQAHIAQNANEEISQEWAGIIQKIKDKLRKGDQVDHVLPEEMAGIIQKIKDKIRRGEETNDEIPLEMAGIIKKIRDKIQRGDEAQAEEMAGVIQKIKDKIKDKIRKGDETVPEEMEGVIQKIKDKIKDKIRKGQEETVPEEMAGIIQKIKDKIRKGKAATERPEGWADCIEQDVDEYLDKILEKVRAQIEDPMRLPPRSSFVELSEGRVWGMSDIYRKGPLTVTCHENNTIIISGKIATDELKGRYTWEKEFRGKKKEGFILIKTNDFEADVELAIHQKSEENYPILQQFKIRRFKDIKVEMTGLGLFSWALAEITTMLSGVFQWGIARAVQGPLREALERELMDVAIN